MKSIKTIIVLYVAIFFSLSGISSAAQTIGILKEFTGRVDVLKNGRLPAKPAKIDMKLHKGDVIRTKTGAKAVVVFADGVTLRIGERTRVNLAEYFEHKDGILKVARGSVWVDINRKIWKGKHFKVVTPIAVAGVRGTSFVVIDDPVKMIASIAVLRGTVYSYNPRFPNYIITITAGKFSVIQPDSPPSQPKTLSLKSIKELRNSFNTNGRKTNNNNSSNGNGNGNGNKKTETKESALNNGGTNKKNNSPASTPTGSKSSTNSQLTNNSQTPENPTSTNSEQSSSISNNPTATSTNVEVPITQNNNVSQSIQSIQSASHKPQPPAQPPSLNIESKPWINSLGGGVNFSLSSDKNVNFYVYNNDVWQSIGSGTSLIYNIPLSKFENGGDNWQIKAVDSNGNSVIKNIGVIYNPLNGNIFYSSSGTQTSVNGDMYIPTIEGKMQDNGILNINFGESVNGDIGGYLTMGTTDASSTPVTYFLFKQSDSGGYSSDYISLLGSGYLNGSLNSNNEGANLVSDSQISFIYNGWVAAVSSDGNQYGLFGIGKNLNGEWEGDFGGYLNSDLASGSLFSYNFKSEKFDSDSAFSYDGRYHTGYTSVVYSLDNAKFIGRYISIYHDFNTGGLGIEEGGYTDNGNAYYSTIGSYTFLNLPNWSYNVYNISSVQTGTYVNFNPFSSEFDIFNSPYPYLEVGNTESLISNPTINLNVVTPSTKWGIAELGISGGARYAGTDENVDVSLSMPGTNEDGDNIVVYGSGKGSVDKDLFNPFKTYAAFTNLNNDIKSGIFVGETIGVIKSGGLSLDSTGVWFDTDTLMNILCPNGSCTTNEGALTSTQKTLLNLGVPVVNVGKVNLSYSGGSSGITSLSMDAYFFSSKAGTKPSIWLSNDVKGTYTSSVAAGDTVTLTNSATSSSATFDVTKWDTTNNKWTATITGNVNLKGGSYNGAVGINGVAGGAIDTTKSSFAGSSAGVVAPPSTAGDTTSAP